MQEILDIPVDAKTDSELERVFREDAALIAEGDKLLAQLERERRWKRVEAREVDFAI